MKKILYVYKGEYPWDIRADKICNSLVETGFDVTILARRGDESLAEESINGLNIIRVGAPNNRKLTLPIPFNPYWRKAISECVKAISPDLIIVREIMLAIDVSAIAQKSNIPVIIDMAENYPAAMREFKKYNDKLLSRILVKYLKIPDIVEKKAVRASDGIIVVCEEQISRIAANYGYNSQKCSVVYNTPHLAHFAGINYANRPRNDSFVFGHHGFLSGDKSILNLIKGFLLACESDSNITLKIAGEGECLEDYRSIVDSSKFKDKVEFLGSYKYQELPQIISTFDVGVIPYPPTPFNNTTIHNKIFDFFACGTPVLTSDAKPIARIISEIKAGLSRSFATPESAKNALLEMKNENLELFSRQATFAAQSKYNWACDAKELVRFIDRYIIQPK